MTRWFVLIVMALATCATVAKADVILTPDEIKQIVRLGPWPVGSPSDPSNRVSGDEKAIQLGKVLFEDASLSSDGTLSCASCHIPDQDFADGKPRAVGLSLLDRNTQSLWNLSVHRWFGWSGDSDSVWAQNLTPLFNEKEMAQTPASLQDAMKQNPQLESYEALFGPIDDETPVRTSVNIAKALAAYIETLVSGKTSFDRFRDALADDDNVTASAYPEAAQRGLKTFLGSGNCVFCHSGPAFTNGEFHDAGVPYFLEEGRVDAGRTDGLEALAASPFTLDGDYNDDPSKSGAWAVRNVRFQHSNFGIFRVPSLRRVTKTAPYMHNGSLPDLMSVLRHYNEIDMERLHSDGEAILRPMGLNESELEDLHAFLETLSDD